MRRVFKNVVRAILRFAAKNRDWPGLLEHIAIVHGAPIGKKIAVGLCCSSQGYPEMRYDSHMIYSYILKKKVVEAFRNVQAHKYDDVMSGISANITHHFAGDHALGGTRRDLVTLRKWFERLGRVLPNLEFEVKSILVKGMPWDTTVIARWVATARLKNGEFYTNPGVHIINLRWGKAYRFDVYEDTQAVANGLAQQATAGIPEAVAAKLES